MNLYNGPDSINPTSQLFADNYTTNAYAGFALRRVGCRIA
jgi:hypothetical protein